MTDGFALGQRFQEAQGFLAQVRREMFSALNGPGQALFVRGQVGQLQIVNLRLQIGQGPGKLEQPPGMSIQLIEQ